MLWWALTLYFPNQRKALQSQRTTLQLRTMGVTTSQITNNSTVCSTAPHYWIKSDPKFRQKQHTTPHQRKWPKQFCILPSKRCRVTNGSEPHDVHPLCRRSRATYSHAARCFTLQLLPSNGIPCRSHCNSVSCSRRQEMTLEQASANIPRRHTKLSQHKPSWILNLPSV